jgi:hypothetical protein
MKLVVLLVVILMLDFFCSAALGDDWDSFEGGDDSSSSSVGVNVNVGDSSESVKTLGSDTSVSKGRWVYTQDFYIALGVGAFGVLVVAVFLYFFFRRPKNRWERKAHK